MLRVKSTIQALKRLSTVTKVQNAIEKNFMLFVVIQALKRSVMLISSACSVHLSQIVIWYTAVKLLKSRTLQTQTMITWSLQ